MNDSFESTQPIIEAILKKSPTDENLWHTASSSASDLRHRASELIVQVPVEHLKKLRHTKGATSVVREIQHFVGITTLHGPLRIFDGKLYARLFWLFMLTTAICLFIYQLSSVLGIYTAKPTVSQVSFILPEDGLELPKVTICSYNPIRRSYVESLNSTGQFNQRLLAYLILSYTQVQALYDDTNRSELCLGENELQNYIKNVDHNFTINDFFMQAGFTCEEMLKMCTFGGRVFDCCNYSTPVLTDLGKCYEFDLRSSNETWMRRQKQAGVFNGLQFIADFHLEEVPENTLMHHLIKDYADEISPDPLFSNAFENGFRFYVHDPEAISYLSTEGISVSPGSRVYSAINPSRFLLLPEDQWGNCTNQWMSGYKTTIPYSATNCKALCRAKFFMGYCGCSPFIYNIDSSYPVCRPLELYNCIETHGAEENNRLMLPSCAECKVECESWLYYSYNSYGYGFSQGALSWLRKKNSAWSPPHVRANFVAINIFFRDMSYTEYQQVQATSLTQTLSNIGGNMGMWFGASVITVCEVIIFVTKTLWLMLSKKRRAYMLEKETREQERERQLDDAIADAERRKSQPEPTAKLSKAREQLRRIKTNIASSFRRDAKPKIVIDRQRQRKLSVDNVLPVFNQNHQHAKNDKRRRISVASISPILNSEPSNYYGINAVRRRAFQPSYDPRFIEFKIELAKLRRPSNPMIAVAETNDDHDDDEDNIDQDDRRRSLSNDEFKMSYQQDNQQKNVVYNSPPNDNDNGSNLHQQQHPTTTTYLTVSENEQMHHHFYLE